MKISAERGHRLRGRRTPRVASRSRGLLGVLLALQLAACATPNAPEPGESASQTLAEGQAALAAGDFARARGRLAEAVLRAADSQRPDIEIDALLALAETERALGDPDAAIARLGDASGAAEKLGDARRVAALRVALGGAELARGRAARAAQELRAGAEAARAAGAPELEAAALGDLASLRALQGDSQAALELYAQSAEAADAAGDGLGEARALANAARVVGDDAARALPLVMRAAQRAESLPPSHARATLQLNLALRARSLAEASPARRQALRALAHSWLSRALETADSLGDDTSAAYALGALGSLYADEGRDAEALALTRRALARAGRADAAESSYRWYAQEGRLLVAAGEAELAIDAYERAVEILQTLRDRQRWGGALRNSSFRAEIAPIYYAQVELLLDFAAQQEDPSQRQRLLLRARNSVERLKAAELRDYFRDDCVDALRGKLAGLEEISSAALVVYPIALPERLVVLASLPSGQLRQYSRPIPRERVDAEAHALRAEIERASGRRYLPHARKLYEWLIAPLEAELRGPEVETLVFVPDGALLTIPMAALHDGEGFLIERFAVATTPGLELTDPRPLERGRARALMGGVSQGVSGFAPLPHVAEELAGLREVLDGEVLLDADFRSEALRESLAGQAFGVVHLATHAEFSEDAAGAFLLTWDGRLSLDELASDVGLFRFRDEPLELLTLSACETARGDERAALGLSGIAVKAGARSALGTLWSVNDPSAAALVRDFYTGIIDAGLSRSVALQRAQQALLADFRYRHPVYWAPYVLIGSWL